MKKILILGAGNAQIDAILFCKSKGYEVHGCSYTNTDRGIPYLDHFALIDIKDSDSVCEYAKDNKIDIIYSIGSDLSIPTVMEVSTRLGLPHFISAEAAVLCQSKYKMRRTLGSDFDGNLPYTVCSSLEEALKYKDYPAMMKPVDSQGQRGCFCVKNTKELREHFSQSIGFSIEGKIILEPYIQGPEISVSIYLSDDEVKFAAVSDRITYEEFPGGIIKEHVIPSRCSEAAARRSVSIVTKAMKKIGVHNGPAFAQLKIRNGQPYILEMAPRLDGCHMWNLFLHYCHINLLEITFSHLIDGTVPNFCCCPQPGEWKLHFLCCPPGKQFRRSDYDTANSHYLCWYYKNGETVRKLNGYMEKGGYKISSDLALHQN